MVLVAASWPAAVLPRPAMFMPENQSASGGLSILGNEQIIVAPSARWRARASGPVVTENSVLSWRAFVGAMHGRAGTALVPPWDKYGVRDANGRRLSRDATSFMDGPFAEGGLNFDLSGWGQDDMPVYATLAASGALNSTQIAVNYAPGIDGVRPGQYFGIGHRLYLCYQTWQIEEGGPAHIRFTPWLREAVTEGTPVIIDRPVCLMRFADDQTGELELDMGRWGQGGLEFVEAW